MNWYKKAQLHETDEEFAKANEPPWVLVESNSIESIAYYELAKVLEVKFKRDGKVYHHFGVSKKTYEDFLNAKSKGEFYNRIIRKRYKSRQ